MSSTESFDELEKQLAQRIEDALKEIREDFLERLQGTTGRLEEMVSSEMSAVRDEAAATAELEAEEARASLLAEAEEDKARGIAEAITAKESEFHEVLGIKDAALGELESARDAALAEARDARESAFAEAEEAKAAAIAEALEAKEAEFDELIAAKDETIVALEESREASLAELREEMDSAVSAARSAAEETLTGAVSAAIHGLHQAFANIDGGRSQTEVLEALLTSSARHSSRSILFLTREDGLHGWGGQGFDTEEGRLQEVHLDYAAGSALAELAEGRGTVELSGGACGDLLKAVDGSEPRQGVLIPLVLRDRLAATLYADRLEDDSPFEQSNLQLLTFVAGQALETLPIRQRSATATLRLNTEAPDDEPGLGLWQFFEVDEPEVEELEPVPVPAEPMEVEAEEPLTEPEPEAWEEEPSATPELTDYVAVEESGFAMEDEVVSEEPEVEPVLEQPMPEPEYPVEYEAPIEAAQPMEEAPPTEIAPPMEVAPPVAAGAEVAAPENIDGPGWAFTTRRFSEGSEDDAGHEEARRLARLLVTEIKLYNEEQVEEGRRGRNIYRTLREDIDRSRQIYEERVADAVRSDTDYFRDELVRILAGGDEDSLGE